VFTKLRVFVDFFLLLNILAVLNPQYFYNYRQFSALCNLPPNIDPNQIWGLRANCNFYWRKLMEKLEQIYRANQFTCQTTPGFSFSTIEKKNNREVTACRLHTLENN
jgi:hypothetical protein